MASTADTGHVAIDDIVFSPGEECPMEGVCDFQLGFCNWKNDDTDAADWMIGNNGVDDGPG